MKKIIFALILQLYVLVAAYAKAFVDRLLMDYSDYIVSMLCVACKFIAFGVLLSIVIKNEVKSKNHVIFDICMLLVNVFLAFSFLNYFYGSSDMPLILIGAYAISIGRRIFQNKKQHTI